MPTFTSIGWTVFLWKNDSFMWKNHKILRIGFWDKNLNAGKSKRQTVFVRNTCFVCFQIGVNRFSLITLFRSWKRVQLWDKIGRIFHMNVFWWTQRFSNLTPGEFIAVFFWNNLWLCVPGTFGALVQIKTILRRERQIHLSRNKSTFFGTAYWKMSPWNCLVHSLVKFFLRKCDFFANNREYQNMCFSAKTPRMNNASIKLFKPNS